MIKHRQFRRVTEPDARLIGVAVAVVARTPHRKGVTECNAGQTGLRTAVDRRGQPFSLPGNRPGILHPYAHKYHLEG